ncbi:MULTISPECIES: hypothetical protein [unclassified Mameliella]|uniref:hypothetical protein n=1 Tax=unclassified Mameliella TaxID=2630630 RepID=UPI00273F51EC|nr:MULTISPECIES: hypothetical protein [unclassified Mameliella]
MMKAHSSDLEITAERKGWISRLDSVARRPGLVAAALGFAALNAAAAVTVLVMMPDDQGPTAAPATPVTVSKLAPTGKPTPAAEPRHAALSEVVHRLPRAQTWHPPHQLPSGRDHSVAPDIARSAPVGLAAPRADGLPTPGLDSMPLALASLPRDVTPEPDKEILNSSLVPQIATLGAVRPRARPELDIPETPETIQVAVSLRPKLRPEGLKLPAPSIDRAPEAAAPTATLAALPRAIERPVSGATCNSRLTRAMPNRRGSAKGGDAVMAGLMRTSGTERDRRVAREILAGNMPSFLQDLVPVQVSGRARDGSPIRITFCATPDYLAVGSDRDFVRVPMGLPAAMQIAARFDMMLPTRRMVDQIYRAADTRVAPKPMTPGPQMSSTDYLVRHNRTVEGQLRGASVAGHLTSGHKKDLVLTNRLNSNRGRVAIYGWHRTNGKAIQPLSTVHGATYADYSHGVRLISQTAYLNGRPVRLADLMADPDYASLISDEGPIRAAQLRVASAN